MKTLTTTVARKNLAELIDTIKSTNEIFAIGRRNKPEVIVMKFPETYNPAFDEITNLNAMSGSFDFLADEPDLYTRDDIKFTYGS